MKQQKQLRSVAEQALKDIADYLKEDIADDTKRVDKLIVSATQLNNKVNRYLNRLLKLHTINKLDNKNGKK